MELIKTFELVRETDVTGASGTGVVAQGAIFRDGTVALHWLTARASTAVYRSIEDVAVIHGHEGATVVDRTDATFSARMRVATWAHEIICLAPDGSAAVAVAEDMKRWAALWPAPGDAPGFTPPECQAPGSVGPEHEITPDTHPA